MALSNFLETLVEAPRQSCIVVAKMPEEHHIYWIGSLKIVIENLTALSIYRLLCHSFSAAFYV